MAEITFVGTGEATDPDRPNTSMLYRGDRTLLFDCGYSVPQAFWQVTRDPHLLDAIFISHRHGDHTFGLPGLLLWMREQGRTDVLHLFASAATGAVVRDVVELAYPGLLEDAEMFPVEIVAVAESWTFGACTLRVAQSRHGEENLALRIEASGHAVCFSGDGGMTDATRELYRGADLLVHECHRAEPGSSGHANARDLLAEVTDLEVQHLALVHVAAAAHAAVNALVDARQPSGAAVSIPVAGDVVRLRESIAGRA